MLQGRDHLNVQKKKQNKKADWTEMLLNSPPSIQGQPSTPKKERPEKESYKGLKDAAPVGFECCCTRLLKKKNKKHTTAVTIWIPSQVNLQ